MKLNHNDFLNYPNTYDQVMFAGVRQAADLGAVGVGATIYFGSEGADRQIVEVSRAFAEAHRLGMFTVLWCYLRNSAFKQGDTDYHLSADLTGQANHLGVTIEADIIKQKQPENNGGYNALQFGKTDPLVYSQLTTDHPIDLTRWQVVNCYAGRIPLINSGGESKGADDLAQAVRTAVINKRAGGAGLIVGRKAFQRPTEEGAALIHASPGRLPGRIGDRRLSGAGRPPRPARTATVPRRYDPCGAVALATVQGADGRLGQARAGSVDVQGPHRAPEARRPASQTARHQRPQHDTAARRGARCPTPPPIRSPPTCWTVW